jgi:hypothetical protein
MVHKPPNQPEREVIIRFIESKQIDALSSLLAIKLHKYDKKKNRRKCIKSADWIDISTRKIVSITPKNFLINTIFEIYYKKALANHIKTCIRNFLFILFLQNNSGSITAHEFGVKSLFLVSI